MPYLMPSGKWRAKRMIHGRVKTRICMTKQEAKKWEAEQDEEKWRSGSRIPSVCLLEFCNAYLRIASERFSSKTVAEKKLAFRYLFQSMHPDMAAEKLTAGNALEILRNIALASSGYAANKARKNLAASWEWGKKYYGLPTINPFREVDKFPADQKPRYVPPEADFWKVYEAASSVDKVFLLFMLHTGARRSEAFRLQWSDVDRANRKIRLGTRKTSHGGMEYAWVPMTSELREVLGAHKLVSKSKYVFTSQKTGLPYTARQHMMEQLCNKAKVSVFGFHAIRHLSATILANEGLPIPDVQTILRHHNPNTTARYIKSLGIQPEKLDRVFTKRRGSKVLPFEPLKDVIGT